MATWATVTVTWTRADDERPLIDGMSGWLGEKIMGRPHRLAPSGLVAEIGRGCAMWTVRHLYLDGHEDALTQALAGWAIACCEDPNDPILSAVILYSHDGECPRVLAQVDNSFERDAAP